MLTTLTYLEGQYEPISLGTFISLTICHSSLMRSGVMSEVIHPSQHKHLSPTNIIPIIESFTTIVCDLLEKEGSRLEGISIPLSDFVLPVLYQASGYAFFGRSLPAMELYEPLNDFDGSFHLALAGVPRVFLRKHAEGLAAMHRLFEKYFDGPHKDVPEFVLESEQVMRNHGYVCFPLKLTVTFRLLIECMFRIRRPSGLTLFLSSLL